MITMDGLTPDQRAGQRLMAGFDGTAFNSDLAFLIGDLKVGGIILFSRNIETPGRLSRLCLDMREYAKSVGQPPLFIAIDQEGGVVARLRAPHFQEFPEIRTLADPEDAIRFAKEMADQLKPLGVNMNMAPVLDVAPADMESIMVRRSFGPDPHHAARMGRAMIETFQANGVLAVAKHFPGIGRTLLDSHLDMPEFAATLEDLTAFDLIPFQAAHRAGVAGMMLSHIFYSKIDPQWPASLSPAIAAHLLRRRLGFEGLSLTDDLDMGAIARHFEIKTVIRQVLEAQIDMALICHKGPNIETAWETIRRETDVSPRLKGMHQLSVERILAWKRWLASGPG